MLSIKNTYPQYFMIKRLRKIRNDNKLVRRFRSLNKILKVIFIVACCSIILIELWLIPLFKSYPTIDTIQNIYLKLSYSIAGSTIFFFINVHWPRQEDKMKFQIYVMVRVGQIFEEIQYVLENALNVPVIFNVESITIDEDLLDRACENFDPDKSFSLPHLSNRTFTWYSYEDEFNESIAQNVDDLRSVPEIIDKATSLNLLKIKKLSNKLCNYSPPSEKPKAYHFKELFKTASLLYMEFLPATKKKY